MKNEHSELTKKFSSYNKKAIEALDTIDSTCLMKIIENSLLDNNNIIIYDIKKRLKRNDFFESLIEKISYEHCRNEIHRIYSISQGAEQLYDKIKTFIKSSDISKHAIDKQIWSHINRTESEFEYVYEELYTDIEKSMAMNDILTGIYINGTDGETVQADIAIEAYNHYLCMYLKMVAHENNFYDINGVLTLPQETMVNDTLIYEAGSILAASIAWFKLEEFSIKSLCFGGNYSRHLLQDFIKNDDIQSINSTEGIENKYVHYFQMKTTEYLLSDLISNARYFFKKYQNNIELSLENYDSDYILEKTGLNDIHEFSSLIFLQNTLFLENNIFTKEFGGLTLIEWIKGYSSLSTYAKNNISSPSLILSKNELIQLLNYRIESKGKIELLIKYLTFNKKSKDLFDSPLIKVKGSKYYICKPSLISISIDEAILSTLSTWGIKTDKKGYHFENYVNANLSLLGLTSNSLKFKIHNEQYEYDSILVFDKRVFILECKNRSPTKNQINSIIYKQRDLLDYIEQIRRLKEGLLKNPDEFNKKFHDDINKYEIIPIILFNHTFTYPKTSDGVYVIDSSIFFRFFKAPYTSMDVIHERQKHNIFMSEKFWSGDKPTSDDFIKYIENPPQIRPFIKNIKTDRRAYPIDKDNVFTGNDIIISNFL